jgi:hypothetical protein
MSIVHDWFISKTFFPMSQSGKRTRRGGKSTTGFSGIEKRWRMSVSSAMNLNANHPIINQVLQFTSPVTDHVVERLTKQSPCVWYHSKRGREFTLHNVDWASHDDEGGAYIATWIYRWRIADAVAISRRQCRVTMELDWVTSLLTGIPNFATFKIPDNHQPIWQDSFQFMLHWNAVQQEWDITLLANAPFGRKAERFRLIFKHVRGVPL